MMLRNIEDANHNEELDATPMKCQVAGHSFQKDNKSLGLMTVSGGFVLKPILKPRQGRREVEFYESIQELKNWNDTSRELKYLVPAYFGTRELWISERRVQWLVLEDVSHGFAEPCIMDIKIGRQTWDPEATQEKIQNEMVKYSASKRDLGFCIPGFQVYDVNTRKLHRFDSNYGKSLDGDGVRDALRAFLNGHTAFSRALLLQILAKLWQILRWFRKQNSYHIFGSSILLVYDAAKLRDDLTNKLRLRNNGVHRPTVARQLSLRIPTGPLTPGFEKRVKSSTSDSSRPSTPTATTSHSPSTEDLTNAFDTMCKTHSLENNYERDLQSIKENYSVVLKDLLHDRIKDESWVNAKMIDFAHVFPASTIDKNYLFGLENLVNIFEHFLIEAD